MYEIHPITKRAKKRLDEYLLIRGDIKDKLVRLKINPRRELGAHPLHGKLEGKWACWLGSNVRMIYFIDDEKRVIFSKFFHKNRLK